MMGRGKKRRGGERGKEMSEGEKEERGRGKKRRAGERGEMERDKWGREREGVGRVSRKGGIGQ